MDFDVEREPGQWHIRERGQLSRGMTVTDSWLERMKFNAPSRSNINAIVNAVMASQGGVTLDTYAASRMPKDIAITPGFKSFPSVGRGTRPRNRMRIPDRMMIKG